MRSSGNKKTPLSLYNQRPSAHIISHSPPKRKKPATPPPAPPTPPQPSCSTSLPPSPPRTRFVPKNVYEHIPPDTIKGIQLMFVLSPVSIWFRIVNRWRFDLYPTDVFLVFETTSNLRIKLAFHYHGAYRLPDDARTATFPLFTHQKELYNTFYNIYRDMNEGTQLYSYGEGMSLKRLCRWRVSEYAISDSQLAIYEPHQFIVNVLNQFYMISKKNNNEILFDITQTLTLVEFYSYAQRILAPVDV